MDASPTISNLYGAEQFVESAGTVLFRLSTHEICILRLLNKPNEYVLPKGRRNIGESRQAAAIRETIEETGIPCYLLPVDLVSRLTPTVPKGHLPDEPRLYKGACEPIAMQQRRLGSGGVKLIWWFVAAVSEEEPLRQHEADLFEVEFYSYDEAVQRLTYKDNRDLVERAIERVQAKYNC
ncbi:NUDIX hydrolase domain-like protein [Trichoderma longibrachiatum]